MQDFFVQLRYIPIWSKRDTFPVPEKINQLYSNILWSMKLRMCLRIVQPENGLLGQVMLRCSLTRGAYLMNTAPFFRKVVDRLP